MHSRYASYPCAYFPCACRGTRATRRPCRTNCTSIDQTLRKERSSSALILVLYLQSGTVIYHLYVDVSNTCGWYTSLRMCSGHSVGNCSPCEANMGRHSLKTSCLTTAEWGRRQPAMRRTNASSRGTGTDTHSIIDITRNWSVARGHWEIRIM